MQDPETLPEVPKEKPSTSGQSGPSLSALTTHVSTRDVDLAGAEQISLAGKLGVLHPYMLLLATGMMTTLPMPITIALFAWVALVAGRSRRKSKALSRVREQALDTPSNSVRKGFGAIGWACLLALLAGGLGESWASFVVLNGAWAALTLNAVRSGSKTDAQTGWMAGATSMTAAALFFGVPLAFVAGIPFVVKLTPIWAGLSLWQSWKFMGARGTERSRAAMNAAASAAVATLCFLPATAALIGFSAFEAACHFAVAFGSVLLPIWSMREKLRPELSEGDARPALPSE